MIATIPTPVMADQVGDAMRPLASVIADAYGDEIAEADKTDIRLAVRAALDRVVAEGYAYARTVRETARQSFHRRQCEATCTTCPHLRRGKACFTCGREKLRLADLERSRAAERERLRYGRAR